MPPETVAWLGLGLTVIAQAVGMGFIYGVMATKVNGLRRDFEEHKDYTPGRGHAAE